MYREAVPALCWAVRRFTSVVTPVYSEPSEHRKMYRNHTSAVRASVFLLAFGIPTSVGNAMHNHATTCNEPEPRAHARGVPEKRERPGGRQSLALTAFNRVQILQVDIVFRFRGST